MHSQLSYECRPDADTPSASKAAASGQAAKCHTHNHTARKGDEFNLGCYLKFLWIACTGAPEARATRRLLLRAPTEPLHAGAPSAEASVAGRSVGVFLLQSSDLIVHRGPALDDWAVPAGIEEGSAIAAKLGRMCMHKQRARWQRSFINHAGPGCCVSSPRKDSRGTFRYMGCSTGAGQATHLADAKAKASAASLASLASFSARFLRVFSDVCRPLGRLATWGAGSALHTVLGAS